MNVSLDQAIEMHAKALKGRAGKRAPRLALEKAHTCAAAGDLDGHAVWTKVAEAAQGAFDPRARLTRVWAPRGTLLGGSYNSTPGFDYPECFSV